jgi:hypothetical protein
VRRKIKQYGTMDMPWRFEASILHRFPFPSQLISFSSSFSSFPSYLHIAQPFSYDLSHPQAQSTPNLCQVLVEFINVLALYLQTQADSRKRETLGLSSLRHWSKILR